MLRQRHHALSIAASLLLGSQLGYAYDLDIDSTDSIKDVASKITEDLLSFYTGDEPGQTPGLLPSPYYWWEAGAMLGSLVDYWYYTGDDTYNDLTTQGLLHQVGPYNDYMPPNQTLTEGNDDQGFWGMTVMSAAEYNFPDPPEDQPQWLALAQAVFNTQAARWDETNCNGGLRWQIFSWNNGYNYKNSISQACFFNIAARLALYTGNTTYVDWAVKTWDWMVDVKFIADNYRIYDGAHIEDGCTSITPYEFSYNVGAFLLGAAAMYEYYNAQSQTSDSAVWREHVDGLLNATEDIFFFGNSTEDRVMIEIACEPVDLCDVDQLSFKAYLSRWMAATTKWAPWSFDRVKTLLRNSASAAAKQCTGGDNGRMCGFKWANNSAGTWDGTTGVGQQMSAMEVVLGNMIQEAKAPVTNSTGGTSTGDPDAGSSVPGGSDDSRALAGWRTITAGDRAGAAICTAIVLSGFLTGLVFLLADEARSPRENWDSFRSSVAGVASGAAFAQVAAAAAGKRPTADEKGKRVDDESSAERQPPPAPGAVVYPLPHHKNPGRARMPQYLRNVVSKAPPTSAPAPAPAADGARAPQEPAAASRTNARGRLLRRPFQQQRYA